MLKREVLGEKLMQGVKAGIRECLQSGGCDCTGGGNFTSSSEVWIKQIEADEPV